MHIRSFCVCLRLVKLLRRDGLIIRRSHTSTRGTGSSATLVINFLQRIGNSCGRRLMPFLIFLSFQIISRVSTAIESNSSRASGRRLGSVQTVTSRQVRETLRAFRFPALQRGETLFLSSRSSSHKTNMRTVNCRELIAVVSLVTIRKANLPHCRRAAAVVIESMIRHEDV